MIAYHHRVAAHLRLLHRLRVSFPRDESHLSAWIGQYGEYAAASWLRAQRQRILRQNFRHRGGGEIDIVSRDGDTLVFCEVKTRRSRDAGAPARAVNQKKRELLRRAAQDWLGSLRAHQKNIPYRFDIVEVILTQGARPQLKLLPDAFGSHEGERSMVFGFDRTNHSYGSF